MNTIRTPISKKYAVLAVLVFSGVFFSGTLFSEGNSILAKMLANSERASSFAPLFPYALQQSVAAELIQGKSIQFASVMTQEETMAQEDASSRLQSVLLNNDIFALYGKPGARNMGILGQYPLSQMEEVMKPFVDMYDAANDSRGIIPSLYIIYGTCWPEGEIGILSEKTTREYIEYAAERGWYVYLDHQIGRYSVESAMTKLLPWLKYPNVHLALDPEWRTTKPMQEIGYVTADELNTAQQMMQDYLVEQGLPGRRMLVVHQFKPKMIENRPAVKSDFELVKIIHCADGFGSPALKKNTYAHNALAQNMPLKSFKLFLEPTIAGAGWDKPLMTPEEVFQLNPRPYLIMYQ